MIFSVSPQVHSTVQSSCLREGKNRSTTRGTCLWESTRKRSKPYLFLCYLYLMLLFFLHFSHVLTKVVLLQISAFFLFSNFRKRQIALYSPCRLVGRLTSPLIFSIYRGIKALYELSTT